MAESDYVAAWVPDDDPRRPWDEAADLAVAWVLSEVERSGGAPLLVTPTQSQWSCGVDSIEWLAQNYQATTPRSNRPSSGHGPVLVYVPDYETFQLAARYARGASLAVVESVSDPVSGWAMEVGALNLITSEPTPDTRTDLLREELDRLHFYGNNGWTSGYGQEQAKRLLRDLRSKGQLDRGLVLGYMLAKQHNGKSIARLGKIIDQLS